MVLASATHPALLLLPVLPPSLPPPPTLTPSLLHSLTHSLIVLVVTLVVLGVVWWRRRAFGRWVVSRGSRSLGAFGRCGRLMS